MSTRITDPTVILNNSAVFVAPDSVSYNAGAGEGQTAAQTAGGGTIQIVHSVNLETRMSTVKFSVLNTVEAITDIEEWKQLKSTNAIAITGEGGFSKAFNNMTLITDVEIGLGSDSTIELEFKGDPAV